MSAGVVGIVGAGGISRMHLLGWLRLGYEAMVFSRSSGDAIAVTQLHGGKVAASLEELFDRCDVVDICTPTDTHRDLVERAAAAGKHVVCEKPLALTVDDCDAMIRACDAAKVRLFPAHVVRYFPAYASMRAAVAAGDIGNVAVQRFYRGGPAPRRHSWFFDLERSGGIAMDLMIHDLDMARWVAGEVATVHATSVHGCHETERITAQVVLQHHSGAISHVNGVWGSSTMSFRTGYQVAGGGLLEHDSLAHPVLVVDGLDAAEQAGYLPPVDPASSPYTEQLGDFARALATGEDARVTATDGLEAVRIAVAANRSIAEGKPVALEDSGSAVRRHTPGTGLTSARLSSTEGMS